MNDILALLLLFYIILELFEWQWQRADSMMGMLVKMYKIYNINILLFLLMHPTFMFGIWLVMRSDFSMASVILLFVKTVDIATKILLIQQIFEKRQLSQEMSMMLLTPLHPLLPFVGLIAYTPMVYLALVG